MAPIPPTTEALFQAIDAGDEARVRDAIAAGADPNAKSGLLATPALVSAVEKESLDVVRALLEAGADPNLGQDGGDHPLLPAARTADLPLIEALLHAGADVNRAGPNGMTALMWAVWWSRETPGSPTRPGYVDAVRRLLAARADANARDENGATALLQAASLGADDVVAALLDGGADASIADEEGATPAARALGRGFADVVARLAALGDRAAVPAWAAALARGDAAARGAWLKAGGDANATDAAGLTPLGWAARLGREDAVRALLAAGARPDTAYRDETPLFAAARLGHGAAARVLVGGGAKPNVPNKDDETALDHAAGRGDLELVTALLGGGARPRQKKGTSPLQRAIWGGHDQVALALIAAGAGVEGAVGGGEPPLAAAATGGRAAVVRALLEAGADVAKKNAQALVGAADRGHTEVVRLLLGAGAKPDAKVDGETALLRAAANGHEEVARALVEGGASLEVKSDGFTPLLVAAQRGHAPLVRRFVEGGAKLKAKGKLLPKVVEGDAAGVRALLGVKGTDPNESDGAAGWPALTWAALLGAEEIAAALLDGGADAQRIAKTYPQTALLAASLRGRTAIVRRLAEAGALADPRQGGQALMGAAAEGHAEAVRALVDAGADPDFRGDRGRTPLMEAADGGHLEAARALVERGADPRKETPIGESAIDIAERRERGDMIALLRAPAPVRAAAPAAPAAPSAPVAKPAAAAPAAEQPIAARPRAANEAKALQALLDAASRGDVAAVQREIAAGADVSGRDPRDQTPALAAFQKRHAGVLDVLVAAGADVRTLLAQGGLDASRTAMARRIVEAGADVEHPGREGRRPLSLAAAAGNLDLVELFLARGADPDARDERGGTPLLYACHKDHEDVARALLRAGADPAAGDGTVTPLALAARGRHPELARALLLATVKAGEPGADLLRAIAQGDGAAVQRHLGAGVAADTAEPVTKWPALLWASLFGQAETARALARGGAAVDGGKDGWTPLALAVAAKDRALAEALLEAGASPQGTMGLRGSKFLIEAIVQGAPDLAILLLRAGAGPETTSGGATALHFAARLGQLDVVRALLDAGAKVEAKSDRKRTPLVMAVQYGRLPIVSALIAARAKVDVTMNDRSLLHWAVQSDRTEAARLLLAARADPRAADGDKDTALHAAARRGRLDLVTRLLQGGADPRARGAEGRTPLLDAATAGHAGIVRALLAAGADASARDDHRRSAAILAAEEGETDVLRALAEAGLGEAGPLLAAAEGDGAGIGIAFAKAPPAAAVVLAGRLGRADALRTLLARKPAGDLTPALRIARDEGFAAVAEALEAAGVRLNQEAEAPAPSIEAVDTVAELIPMPDLPVVFEGRFSRYYAVPPERFGTLVERHLGMGEAHGMAPLREAVDADMTELGFLALGDLVSDRIKDVLVRGYGAEGAEAVAVWNLGPFGGARDFVSTLDDGSSLTTTTHEETRTSAARRSYARALVDAPSWVLHHKHALRVARRAAALSARPQRAPATLAGLAAALDAFLVRRFGL
jgi:ankyrin repeat protein